jgi:glycosyltransferase involved in cell wall biosynthesis
VKLPLISIIIPSLNSKKFLKDTLYSVKHQSYKNFEIIISDGGSKDSTLKIIKSYNFRNIKIISRFDNGVSQALNRGFLLASGNVLCWLNTSDFYLSKDTLLNVANAFQKKIDFAFGHMCVVSEKGKIISENIAHYPLKKSFEYQNNLFTGSLFFTKNTWRQFRGFKEKYKIMFEYQLIDFLFKNCKGYLIDNFLAGWRIHNNSLSMLNKDLAYKESKEIYYKKKKISLFLAKLWRIYALFKQDNLLKLSLKKIYSSKIGKHWKSSFI